MTLYAGPVTGFLAMCAASVGAGVLLGGFAAGLGGVVLSWDRSIFDARVRKAGYFGGAIGLAALVFDGVIA